MTAPGRRPRWPGADLPGRRLFIAVPLTPDATSEIAALVDRVRSEGVPGGGHDVRWVRLDGLHLTLRFLGPTLDDQVNPARDAVRAAICWQHGIWKNHSCARKRVIRRCPAAAVIAMRFRFMTFRTKK